MNIKTTINSVQRQRNTASGNPVYRLVTNDGNFLTEKDGQIAHIADSPSIHGVDVTLEMTSDNRVRRILPVDKEVTTERVNN